MAIRGLDCKLYRNTGTYMSPVWDEVPNVRDLEISLQKAEADGSTRRTTIREYVSTLIDMSIQFEMVRRTGDPDWDAFHTAFWNGDLIEILLLDGPVTVSGSAGLRLTVEVFDFSQSEGLEDVVTNSIELKPSRKADNPPAIYVVP